MICVLDPIGFDLARLTRKANVEGSDVALMIKRGDNRYTFSPVIVIRSKRYYAQNGHLPNKRTNLGNVYYSTFVRKVKAVFNMIYCFYFSSPSSL